MVAMVVVGVILLATGASAAGVTGVCTNTFDASGVAFDLRTLTNQSNPTFMFDYYPYSYKWAPCVPLPGTCNNVGDVMAAQYVNGDCFRNLGVLSSPRWSLLDSSNPSAGVVLAYSGGTECHVPETIQGSTTIKVTCDQEAIVPTGFTYTVEQCSISIAFRSINGCPSEYTSGLSGGWVFVVLLLVAALVYFGGGVAYKKATLGTSGLESIPNIDFWRELVYLATLGTRYFVAKVTCKAWEGEHGLGGGYTKQIGAGDAL